MFDVAKIAQLLQIQMVNKAGNEFIFICPFCSIEKKYPKLYINQQKGVFICHHCHLDGSITDLWALRCGVDTKTAYKQMTKLIPPVDLQAVEEPVPVRDYEKIHVVYSEFLRMLTLNPEHQQNLLSRGLPETYFPFFKSLPDEAKTRWEICRVLHKKYNLSDIPGFQEKISRKGNPYWDCINSGMLIPVKNIHRKITGLQVRRDKGEPKYFWFSYKGQSKGSALIIPGSGVPWIIEGVLKAYVAHYFLKVPCIGIPGTNTWGLIPLELIKGGRVVVAYDIEDNPYSLAAREQLTAFLEEKGFEVTIAGWNRNLGKGIDDACYSLSQNKVNIKPDLFIPGIAHTSRRWTD